MPQTRECDYCGDDIEPGTGTMFVRKSGQTIHYCSKKCEANDDLGREARDQEWTQSGGAPATEEATDE
jgi:large subunit ribosomal protein L24e